MGYECQASWNQLLQIQPSPVLIYLSRYFQHIHPWIAKPGPHIAEHTVFRISLETTADDDERREWLAQGERSLMNTWDKEADDIYNALLTK